MKEYAVTYVVGMPVTDPDLQWELDNLARIGEPSTDPCACHTGERKRGCLTCGWAFDAHEGDR